MYIIDFDKITSIEDIKVILSSLQISYKGPIPSSLEPLVKEVTTETNDIGMYTVPLYQPILTINELFIPKEFITPLEEDDILYKYSDNK